MVQTLAYFGLATQLTTSGVTKQVMSSFLKEICETGFYGTGFCKMGGNRAHTL